MPLVTPNKPRGLFGSMGQPAAQPAEQPAMAMDKPKFNWMELVADTLAGLAGQQGYFAQRRDEEAMLERQTQAQAQRDASQRALDWQDWQRKQQWERDNAAPEKPYRWRSNSGDLMELGQDGTARVVFDDPTDKINWIRSDNGDGTFTMVPMGPNGPMGAAPAAPKAGPKGKLKPYGGPTPPASGAFPGRL